jgi:hypothetical protein
MLFVVVGCAIVAQAQGFGTELEPVASYLVDGATGATVQAEEE